MFSISSAIGVPVVTCTPVSGCAITPDRIFTASSFLALGGEARLSGTAPIEIALDVLAGQRQQRRAAIDHAADRNPMAFAEGRDPEHVAESVDATFPAPAEHCKSVVVTARPGRSNRRFTRPSLVPAAALKILNYTSTIPRR